MASPKFLPDNQTGFGGLIVIVVHRRAGVGLIIERQVLKFNRMRSVQNQVAW